MTTGRLIWVLMEGMGEMLGDNMQAILKAVLIKLTMAETSTATQVGRCWQFWVWLVIYLRRMVAGTGEDLFVLILLLNNVLKPFLKESYFS